MFDGYEEEASLKDHEHMRQMTGGKVSRDLKIILELTDQVTGKVSWQMRKSRALFIIISAELATQYC